MTLFFQEVDANAKAQNLITRLIRLHQAVIEKKITLAELKTIASLTTASLEAKVALLMGGQLDKNDPLRRLYDLLYPETEMAIVDPAQILDALKAFDEKHGDTLVLAPLASENARTFALALNDFAKFYPLFIQYMQCQKRRGALVDEWNVGINLPTAKLAWIDWARTHSTQARYDPNAVEHPGLIEKFLAGQLKKEEWLTDIDLNRAFKLYDLQAQGAHVIPFKVDDIGLALHFERQKHEKDQPKKAYSIPLIVNVSADGHACIDARYTLDAIIDYG